MKRSGITGLQYDEKVGNHWVTVWVTVWVLKYIDPQPNRNIYEDNIIFFNASYSSKFIIDIDWR